MSKQTKVILAGLTAMIFISFIFNIVQCSNTPKADVIASADSTIVLKDSVKRQSDSILNLRVAIGQIEQLANQISGSTLAPVDEIKKITNKYK